MAKLETERKQALRLRPLIVTMGDLGGESAHRQVALEEVMRTSGEDTRARKVTPRHVASYMDAATVFSSPKRLMAHVDDWRCVE